MNSREYNRVRQAEWLLRLKSDPVAYAIHKEKRRGKYKTPSVAGCQKKKAKNQKMKDSLTNAYIALGMGYPVKEVPEEILEIKRLTIQIKRQTKELKK